MRELGVEINNVVDAIDDFDPEMLNGDLHHYNKVRVSYTLTVSVLILAIICIGMLALLFKKPQFMKW